MLRFEAVGKTRLDLIAERSRLDQRIEQLITEPERTRAAAQREKEQRLETERLEKLSARVRPAEIAEVEVLRRYRMVRLFGPTENRISPHLDQMKYYRDEFKILSIRPSRGGERRLEASSYTLTFGNDEGLDKYLEFTGWEDLPDKS